MSERFVDNGDGSISDNVTGLMWPKQDSWLDMGKFLTYRQAKKYANKKNEESFAGHSDWRFPSKEEANSLYFREKEFSIIDRYEMQIYIHPVFTEGCGHSSWTSHTRGKITAYVYSFVSGTGGHYEVDDSLDTSIRLVRGKFDEKQFEVFAKVPPKKGMILMDRK
ncbi:MAG: DUF1566 domain-containing protein [Nitrospinales bacterium]